MQRMQPVRTPLQLTKVATRTHVAVVDALRAMSAASSAPESREPLSLAIRMTSV